LDFFYAALGLVILLFAGAQRLQHPERKLLLGRRSAV